MATVFNIPGAIAPMPAVARIMARYDRQKLAAFIAVAIDLLDTLDGDPDIELNGDELDDPGDLKDNAFIEWETRGRHKLAGGKTETFDRNGEDCEDDDPGGVHDEDGANTLLWKLYGHGPGCEISDPGGCEHDGLENEQGEGVCLTGLDQDRPIGPDNPAMH